MTDKKQSPDHVAESSSVPSEGRVGAGAQSESASSEMPQQSVPEPPVFDVGGGYRASALARMLGRMGTFPGDVHEAVEDIRELIAERVLREVRALRASVQSRIDALEQTVHAKIDALDRAVNAKIDALDRAVNARIDALEKSMNARLDSLQSDIATLRWMVGVLIALVIALIVLVVGSLFFFRSSMVPVASYPVRLPEAYFGEPPAPPPAPATPAATPDSANPSDGSAESPDSQDRPSP